MTNTHPAPRTSRIGLRVLITLALIAFIVIILVFALSQPVSAPGEPTATEETTDSASKRRQATPDMPSLTGGILYMSNRDGDFEIFAHDLPTGDAINLTNNDSADGFPAYAIDAVQISYINEGDTELGGYLMNADGSNQTPAAADLGTFMNLLFAGRGDWDSRPNREQARTLISLRDLNLEIYYQAAGETSQRNLSGNGAIDWYAHLSPDGTRVVFASDRLDDQHDIYVIDVTGENLMRVTDDPADDWSPMWTQDGNGIVFASERGGRFSGGSVGLYVADMSEFDGSARAPILTLEAAGIVPTAPIWQGDYGVMMSNQEGNWEIYVQDSDGNLTNVTNDPADDLFAGWKPI